MLPPFGQFTILRSIRSIAVFIFGISAARIYPLKMDALAARFQDAPLEGRVNPTPPSENSLARLIGLGSGLARLSY